MTPGTFNLVLYRGDTYRWKFVLWADTEKTQAVDLTGVEVAAEIRDKPSGKKVVVIDCTIELPNIVFATLSAANSKLVPSAATTGWDLQLRYATGDVATILSGKVTTTLDITESTTGV